MWYDPGKANAKSVDRLNLEGVSWLKFKDGYPWPREHLESWI